MKRERDKDGQFSQHFKKTHQDSETTPNLICTHYETRLGPGTLCCSAAMLAPGQTSPLATKYKETITN